MSVNPLIRISSLSPGDHVRLVRDKQDPTWGGFVVPAGTTGTLEWLYRIQNDSTGAPREVWSFWIDRPVPGFDKIKRLVCCTDLDLEKIS